MNSKNRKKREKNKYPDCQSATKPQPRSPGYTVQLSPALLVSDQTVELEQMENVQNDSYLKDPIASSFIYGLNNLNNYLNDSASNCSSIKHDNVSDCNAYGQI